MYLRDKDAAIQHLEVNGLVTGIQHGFRKNGSCLSNLLQCLDQVTGISNNDECAGVMYLDSAKALDKIPHGRLMEKLEKHGIGGITSSTGFGNG